MKLFYRKYGDGAPLVILHGLCGSSDNWVTIAKCISNSYTVYLPDLRNHGLSPHNDVNDYNSLSSDLCEFAGELGLGRFYLAGHSMGGKAAIHFTLKNPERICGLVIADISPFLTVNSGSKEFDLGLSILRTILETDVSAAMSRNDIDNLLAGKFHSQKFRAFIMKNLKRTPDNKFAWKINAAALLNNLDKIMEGLPRTTDGISQITGFPVLFLKGENSDYLPSGDWNDILKIFPAAELRIVKNAGHWIHTDNPEAVEEAFISLLEK